MYKFIIGILFASSVSALPLNVVTTTQDLAYFASQVGGERVKVTSLLKGSEDIHYMDARPDFIIKLNKADVFVVVGLELEAGWEPVIRREARNSKITLSGPGYCDASRGIEVLDKAQGTVNRSMGDVHPSGNPHYWTDPLNALIASRNIRDTLIQVDPAGKSIYETNFQNFSTRLKKITLEQIQNHASLKGIPVAVYHRDFAYFIRRFSLDAAVSIEEKPGVPPSASYLKKVIDQMKERKVKVILITVFQNRRYAQMVADQTGAKVLVMPVSVGSLPGVDTYEKSIAQMLSLIEDSIK